ncbi:MauE/DoxX family redox-associated membrane protein [Priestia filamentosa]|uniref:MauE/DoxX family redox-associated membrane protein n=1 Tax=Priestia filamentosa TaxID=1402861 RepID=UPI003982533C
MSIISLIFTTGAGLLLIISSCFKILSLQESAKSVYKIAFIHKKIATIIGYLFPFIELLVAILLIIQVSNIWVNTIAIIIISAFIIINSNAIFKHSNIECFCFGKLLKTKMGIGGLIQSLLLFFSILPNIIFNNSKVISIFSFNEYNFEYTALVIAIMLWTLSLILIRTSLDKLISPNI